MSLDTYAALADLVLATHVAVVLFVIGAVPLIVIGNRRSWRWVNARWFRWLHLATIALVVAQAWVGVVCPLTTLESWLRSEAGQAGYSTSFIGSWMQRLLFHQAPDWVFVIAYTAFGALVVWVGRRYPVESSGSPPG